MCISQCTVGGVFIIRKKVSREKLSPIVSRGRFKDGMRWQNGRQGVNSLKINPIIIVKLFFIIIVKLFLS